MEKLCFDDCWNDLPMGSNLFVAFMWHCSDIRFDEKLNGLSSEFGKVCEKENIEEKSLEE